MAEPAAPGSPADGPERSAIVGDTARPEPQPPATFAVTARPAVLQPALPRVRLATFNVENLTHPGLHIAGRDNDALITAEDYDDKIGWIARCIDEARVDLVGFQELFSWRAINEALQRSKRHSGSQIRRLVAPTIEGGINERDEGGRRICEGPHVGLATTMPVLSYQSIAAFPRSIDLRIPTGLHDDPGEVVILPLTRFERPVLRVRVMLSKDIPATVFVAHLKSKRPRLLPGEDRSSPVVQAIGQIRSLIVRAAEAAALRALVAEVMSDAARERRTEPVIVMGDLNDDVGAVSTQIVAGDEPKDFRLYSVHDMQGERSLKDVAYSHIYNGRYELLDHIMVSAELVHHFRERVGHVAYTRIMNDHLVDGRFTERPPPLPPGIPNPPRRPGTRSDHGVVVSEIEIRGPAPDRSDMSG